MINHEKIRTIQTDIYNHFYLSIKDYPPGEASWKKILAMGSEFADKHQDRVAEILVLAYENILEHEWKEQEKAKDNRPHMCCLCGKEIKEGEQWESVKARGKREKYFHRKCVNMKKTLK